MSHLVVLAGPIGAGKSTIADLLTKRVAREGIAAAGVDLDEITFMQRGVVDLHELWRRGSIATAALVRTLLDLGTEIVVAHGPFFESGGYDALLGAQSEGVTVHHVRLRVSVEVALARVGHDTSRGLSKDPEFLLSTHARFREIEGLLPSAQFEFDTTTHGADEIAADLAAGILAA